MRIKLGRLLKNEGFIRRTIKPALGHLEVRKIRGPILDQLYARLKRCGTGVIRKALEASPRTA